MSYRTPTPREMEAYGIEAARAGRAEAAHRHADLWQRLGHDDLAWAIRDGLEADVVNDI